MRHPRIIIAGISLAATAAVGGVAAVSVSGSPARGAPAASPSAAATVRTSPAAVGGKTESILVDAQGLPLYFYRPDTATKSFVTGGLARLWPPLTSPRTPAAAGVSGKLTVLNDRGAQRPPAVHLHPRPRRPGDWPGLPELLRGHPRPYPDNQRPGADGTSPRRSTQRRLQLLTRPGPAATLRTRRAPSAAGTPSHSPPTSNAGRGWSR